MSSLADELLNDLEDDSPDEEEQQQVEAAGPSNPLKRKASGDVEMEGEDDGEDEDGEDDEGVDPMLAEGGVAPGGIAPAQELDEEEVERMDMTDVNDVRNVAKLEGSKRMVEVLQVSIHVPCSCFMLG